MIEAQQKTLQSLLNSTKKLPPQERLEAMLVSAKTNLGLYQQENDQQGAAIYSPLVELIQESQSVPELLAKARSQMSKQKPSNSV